MAIKFSSNVPLELKFPFGDSREVQGEYGVQHLYTVGAPCRAQVVSLS